MLPSKIPKPKRCNAPPQSPEAAKDPHDAQPQEASDDDERSASPPTASSPSGATTSSSASPGADVEDEDDEDRPNTKNTNLLQVQTFLNSFRTGANTSPTKMMPLPVSSFSKIAKSKGQKKKFTISTKFLHNPPRSRYKIHDNPGAGADAR